MRDATLPTILQLHRAGADRIRTQLLFLIPAGIQHMHQGVLSVQGVHLITVILSLQG